MLFLKSLPATLMLKNVFESRQMFELVSGMKEQLQGLNYREMAIALAKQVQG